MRVILFGLSLFQKAWVWKFSRFPFGMGLSILEVGLWQSMCLEREGEREIKPVGLA